MQYVSGKAARAQPGAAQVILATICSAFVAFRDFLCYVMPGNLGVENQVPFPDVIADQDAPADELVQQLFVGDENEVGAKQIHRAAPYRGYHFPVIAEQDRIPECEWKHLAHEGAVFVDRAPMFSIGLRCKEGAWLIAMAHANYRMDAIRHNHRAEGTVLFEEVGRLHVHRIREVEHVPEGDGEERTAFPTTHAGKSR